MRLIDTKKKLSFKNWIKQHDPQYKWDFNDPKHLMEQFCNVVGESGNIDLKTLYELFFAQEDSGLTNKQHSLFDGGKY